MKYLYIIVLTFLISESVFSQVEKNNQMWLDYNPSYVISNKVLLFGDLSFRTIFPNEWNRYITRISMNYKPFVLSDKKGIVKNMQFHGGVGYFYTQTINGTNLDELRFVQGVRVYAPNFPRVRFSHYLRFEQRFENFNDSELSAFSSRVRYQLKALMRAKNEKFKDLYFPVSIEFFGNFGEGIYFNDAFRVTPAIGYDFTDSFRTEFHISYHNGKNSTTDKFENNTVVYRFRVFQVF